MGVGGGMKNMNSREVVRAYNIKHGYESSEPRALGED